MGARWAGRVAGSRSTGRAGVVLVALAAVLAALLGTGPANAQPPPTPPPNPSERDLQGSQADVAAKAGEIGRLTGELAKLQQREEELQVQLGAQREVANKALVDVQTSRDAAAAAQQRVDSARVETDAATAAIEAARVRLDEFAAAAYQQGADSGPFGLLVGATGPDDLVARAQFNDVIAQNQLAALDALERARVAKANTDSKARAARDDAVSKAAAALDAKDQADAAVGRVQQAAKAQAAELATVHARRAEVERLLTEAESRDAGLRDQRRRYQEWQARLAAEQEAKDRAAARAAQGRVGGAARGGVAAVIDRAMSQLGVTYAWGGGNGAGPTLGVRDGGVADAFGDFRRVGFDCSGLMIYAFAAAGISLPHYSGYQYDAGRKVPFAQRQPGDMLFWFDGSEIHHVALYVGNGQMVEAPFSGGRVRVVPVRTAGLMASVTRLL
jgi:cell wall-associated NlpC family hydrolase